MLRNKIVTSECVSPGHPDKLADQIADRILQEHFAQDPDVRAGIEVMVKDNIVVLGGEIRSRARIDADAAVRGVFGEIRYSKEHGLAPEQIRVINLIGQQSQEIHSGVDKGADDIGAGDQGFMAGYANRETPDYMPLGHWLAREIVFGVYRQKDLGPDAKSQVVVEYGPDGAARVASILVSVQRRPGSRYFEDLDGLRKGVSSLVYGMIPDDIKKRYGVEKDCITVNPCGDWTIGGPVSDGGVTGRKIVVDQFGGYCNVGGGAFSGKDLTKVDRSAAYLCRFYAKNIVASGIASEAKVELGYMIGVADPCAFNIETDTDADADKIRECLIACVRPRPADIIRRFGKRPCFADTARWGHYGGGMGYPWEEIDPGLQDALKSI